MKSKQEGIIPVIVGVIVLGILALGGGAVYYFRSVKQSKLEIKTEEGTEKTIPPVRVTKVPGEKERPPRSSAPTPVTNELADWQEYKNERFPYKIKYPPDWSFLKTGYNPPPPVGVMFSNLPEGYQPGVNSASVDIFVLPAEEKSIEEIGEVKNLVEEQYYQKTPITVSGVRALRLEVPDKSENRFSVYLLYKGNSYRIGFAGSGDSNSKYSDIFQKILNSFTFTD